MSLGSLMMTGDSEVGKQVLQVDVWVKGEVGKRVLQVDVWMRGVQSDGSTELQQSTGQRGDESLQQPILCFVSGC